MTSQHQPSPAARIRFSLSYFYNLENCQMLQKHSLKVSRKIIRNNRQIWLKYRIRQMINYWLVKRPILPATKQNNWIKKLIYFRCVSKLRRRRKRASESWERRLFIDWTPNVEAVVSVVVKTLRGLSIILFGPASKIYLYVLTRGVCFVKARQRNERVGSLQELFKQPRKIFVLWMNKYWERMRQNIVSIVT